jgi:hypothetical protein
MPVDEEALQAALARTAVDPGPGLYGLLTEVGRPVFTCPVRDGESPGVGSGVWRCCSISMAC